MATTTQINAFISKIAPIIQKYAKQYGYFVASPIIAQACLESQYGTSNKAKHHNYFGLKYRPNRCPSSCGTFVDGSKEQNKDGSTYDITDQWFEFKTMEDGVKGYFEFLSISNYDKLRNNITDHRKYLETLIECKYATALKYVDINCQVINIYNLTKYDTFKPETKIEQETKTETKIKAETKKESKKIAFDNNNEAKFEVGDKIKLETNYYYNGKKIPSWVRKSTLFFRGWNETLDGIVFSTKQKGDITGLVKAKYVSKV